MLTFAILGGAVMVSDANRWTIAGIYTTVAFGAVATVTSWIASWIVTKIAKPRARTLFSSVRKA